MSIIRIGPAGWDYPDWAGTVYPKPKPKGFDPLAYLADYFPTIEINSTYYRPLSAKVARSWIERVDHRRDFKFTAKLWKRFTHERAESWSKDELRAVRDGLDVLHDAGKLGAVLLQFPWSFRRDDANEEWLRDLSKDLKGLPLVLEVRHESWNSQEVIEWLAEQKIGLVNVDQPLFRNSIKPSAIATSPVGYVRLHGRNFRQWFRAAATRDERYDYLYRTAELRPWAERIKAVAAKTREMYAVTNNHRFGKAPTNAKMLEGIIGEVPVKVPPDLLRTYSTELAPFASSDHGSAPTSGPRSRRH